MSFSPAAPTESKTFLHFTVSTMSRMQPPRGVNTATPTGAAWPLASLAFYVPIQFNETVVIYQVGCGAGATAGGNFDIGLYTMAGAKIQTTGTTARTNSSWNAVNWTDLTVGPGVYYAAMAADSTATYSSIPPVAGLAEAVGVCEEAVYPLPATATLTRTTRAYIPNIAFTLRSVAI